MPRPRELTASEKDALEQVGRDCGADCCFEEEDTLGMHVGQQRRWWKPIAGCRVQPTGRSFPWQCLSRCSLLALPLHSWHSWPSLLFTNTRLLPALLSLPYHRLQEKKQKEREARSGFRVEQTFNLEDFILPWASGEQPALLARLLLREPLQTVPWGLRNTGFLSVCSVPGVFDEELNALLLPLELQTTRIEAANRHRGARLHWLRRVAPPGVILLSLPPSLPLTYLHSFVSHYSIPGGPQWPLNSPATSVRRAPMLLCHGFHVAVCPMRAKRLSPPADNVQVRNGRSGNAFMNRRESVGTQEGMRHRSGAHALG